MRWMSYRKTPELDALMALFRAHLPKTIADIAFDRVKECVPEQYIKNAIASCLCKLVYKEGTELFELQPVDRLAKIAFEYVSTKNQRLHHSRRPWKMPTCLKRKSREFWICCWRSADGLNIF